MEDTKHISSKRTYFLGSLVVLMGLFYMLIGLGIINTTIPFRCAPAWIVFCAGLAFALAGVAIINNHKIKSLQDILGISIVGVMLVVSGWVSFGPPSPPGCVSGSFLFGDPDKSARIFFGIGFIALLLFFILGVKSIWKKK